jgi:molecular chaperone DnaK (HSP70)
MLVWLLSIWVAIDCGSAFTKAAIATKSKQIEVGKNLHGQSRVATAFAFRPRAGFNFTNPRDLEATEAHLVIPEIGEKALKLAEVRPTFVGAHFPDLIDLNDTYVRHRAGQLHTEIRIGRAPFRDAVSVFYATFLDSITKNKKVEDVVLVVPACYTHHQRMHLRYSLEAVGHSHVTIVDDMNAAAYVFANERAQKFSDSQHTVLFVDIGGIRRYAHTSCASNRDRRDPVDPGIRRSSGLRTFATTTREGYP